MRRILKQSFRPLSIPSLLILTLCSCFLITRGQTSLSRKDSLSLDLKILRDQLTANYPSLYRYNTPVQIDRLFNTAVHRIDNNTSSTQFLKEIKFLLSALKDGHLYAGASKQLSNDLETETGFFPLRLYFSQKKAFLTKSLTEKYPVGTELVSVNGQSVSEIVNELCQYIVGDANSNSKKILILNHVFHFYYFLVYGKQSQFQVQLKAPDGRITEKIIPSVREADLPELPASTEQGKPLQFKITRDKIAVLSIKSFDKAALTKDELDFPLFIQTAFGKLNKSKINRLIIDLRDNGGGRDLYGALLYRYLAATPFRYYKKLYTVTDKLPYQELSADRSSFNNLQPSLLTKTAEGFILKEKAHPNLALQEAASLAYHGKVVFLINGFTFSTAAEFCTIAKTQNRGLFIGTETGGGFDGNTSGTAAEITLPNSGIKLSFGLIQYQMAGDQNRKWGGILPDYTISPTLKDISMYHDPELDFALKLLRK